MSRKKKATTGKCYSNSGIFFLIYSKLLLHWYRAQDYFRITNSNDQRDQKFYLNLWITVLGNYIICKRFEIQTLLWWLEFAIHNKSWARYHLNLKLDSKLNYFNNNVHNSDYNSNNGSSRITDLQIDMDFHCIEQNTFFSW